MDAVNVARFNAPRCGLCHEPCDRPRYIEGVGERLLHPDCETRMARMGYGVRDRRAGRDRRVA